MIEHLETTSGLMIADNLRAATEILSPLDGSYVSSLEVEPKIVTIVRSPLARDPVEAWLQINRSLSRAKPILPVGVSGVADVVKAIPAKAFQRLYEEEGSPELPKTFPVDIRDAFLGIADYVQHMHGELRNLKARFQYIWLGVGALMTDVEVGFDSRFTKESFSRQLTEGSLLDVELVSHTNDIAHTVHTDGGQSVCLIVKDAL